MEQVQTVNSIFPLGEMISHKISERKEAKQNAKYEKIREKLVFKALGLTKETYEVLERASQDIDAMTVNHSEADPTLIKYYVAQEAKRALKSTIKSAVFTAISLLLTILGFAVEGPLASVGILANLPNALKVIGAFGTIMGSIRTIKGAIKAKRGLKSDWVAKCEDFSQEFKHLRSRCEEYMQRVDKDKDVIMAEMNKGRRSFRKFMKQYINELKEEMHAEISSDKDNKNTNDNIVENNNNEGSNELSC